MGDQMTEIYLVKHGQSTGNSEHRWAGQADPPFSLLLLNRERCALKVDDDLLRH